MIFRLQFCHLFFIFLQGSTRMSPERMLVSEDKLCSESAVRMIAGNFGFGLLGYDLPLFILLPTSSNSSKIFKCINFQILPQEYYKAVCNQRGIQSCFRNPHTKIRQVLVKSFQSLHTQVKYDSGTGQTPKGNP